MPLTEEAIQSIIAIPDGAVRNLWITQSYADLAQRLLDVLETDQTWCTFAVWASNTAGVSIRGDELPRFVTTLLLGADPHINAIVAKTNACTAMLRRTGVLGELQRSHLEHLVAEAVAQVSTFIANGNTLVYSELAPMFVRFVEFLERYGTQTLGTEYDVDATLNRLGIPSSERAPLVRQAFQHYALAAASADPHARAEHVLTANIAAVLHEQQRLQGDIASALDAGLLDVGDDLCGIAHGKLAKELIHPIVHEVRAHVTAHLEDLWQHVATRLLMTMSMPGETLHLDRDVPQIPGHTELFPATLEHLGLPPLVALMNEWDPTHGTGHGSAARDWADLHQRMGYIVNLFRSRQHYLVLTVPPFTAEQLAWMADDVLPPSLSEDRSS